MKPMCCSLLLSLFSLLLLVSLSSTSLVSTSEQPNKNSQPNSMQPSERETLFKIMDTISSDQIWRLSYPNPCDPTFSWIGIECKPGVDNHLHVTKLHFGSPPNPTCKNDSKFTSLIFELPYLQSLFFFHCFIYTKTKIVFSENMNFNIALQQLSLRSNPAVIGSVPAQISSLKSLKILTLSQNGVTGNIPEEIFSLTSLLHLDLSYNFLTGTIPNQLNNLQNLVVLDLSYNSLTNSVPSTIGEMGMLQKLDLSSNLLNGSLPNSIENLSSIIFIALSNNSFRGEMPKGLTKLKTLQYFIMDDNPMSMSLPLEFGKLHKLQELRLSNCGFSGSIPPAFSQLMNLSTLSLQNNRLTGEIPIGFRNLSHIYHLNLSENLLDGVVPFTSSFFQRLGDNLDLSGNPGLCLSPSEAYGVKKIGVNVCGSNTTTLTKPLQNSEASSSSPIYSFFLVLLCILGFHHILSL